MTIHTVKNHSIAGERIGHNGTSAQLPACFPGHRIVTLPKTREFFKRVRQEISDGTKLILVNGPAGSGKTTLKKCFIHQWEKSSTVICSESLSDSFREDICGDAATRQSLLNNLNEWQKELAGSKLLLFVLDDIHKLEEDALEFLSQIGHDVVGQFINLAVIAFGDFEACSLYENADPILVAKLDIEPLNLIETEAFIVQTTPGGMDDQSLYKFDDAAIRWIHKETRGYAGRIYTLTMQLISFARQNHTYILDAELVRKFQEYAPNTLDIALREDDPPVRTPTNEVLIPKNNNDSDVLPQQAIDQLMQNFLASEVAEKQKEADEQAPAESLTPSQATESERGNENLNAVAKEEAESSLSAAENDIDKSLSQAEIDALFNQLNNPSAEPAPDHVDAGETGTQSASQQEEFIEITQEQLDALIEAYLQRHASDVRKVAEEKHATVQTVRGRWPQFEPAKSRSLFRKKKNHHLVVEIGTHTLKLLLLNRNLEIEDFFSIPITHKVGQAIAFGKVSEADTEELFETLYPLIESRSLKGSEILVTFAGKNVFSTNLDLVNMPPKELERAVLFEIEGKYNPFEGEERVTRFKIQGTSPKKENLINVYCSVVKQTFVESLVFLFDRLGLKIKNIEPNNIALHDYFCSTGIVDRSTPTLIVDIGALSTDILVAVGDKILLTKTTNTASFSLNQNIADALMVDYNAAEEIKKKFGTCFRPEKERVEDKVSNVEVYEAILPVIEQLSSELKRVVESCSLEWPEYPVQKVILCGGGSRLRDIHEYISNALRLPVARVAIPEQLKIPQGLDLAQNFSPIVAAFGGWIAFFKESQPINFAIKTDLSKSGKYAPKTGGSGRKPALAYNKKTVALIFLLFLYIASFIGIHSAINVLNKKKEEAEVQLSLADEKLEELDSLLKKSRALREQITVVENLIGRRQHFSRALRKLPSLTPAQISIRNLSIRSGRLIIDGSAPDASYFPAFLNKLSQLEEFPEAELRYVNKNEAFGIDYQIVCKPRMQPQQETGTDAKP